MSFVFALIILAVLSGIFIGAYLLNKKVKKPEGCDEDEGECIGCKVSLCPRHPKDKKEKE